MNPSEADSSTHQVTPQMFQQLVAVFNEYSLRRDALKVQRKADKENRFARLRQAVDVLSQLADTPEIVLEKIKECTQRCEDEEKNAESEFRRRLGQLDEPLCELKAALVELANSDNSSSGHSAPPVLTHSLTAPPIVRTQNFIRNDHDSDIISNWISNIPPTSSCTPSPQQDAFHTIAINQLIQAFPSIECVKIQHILDQHGGSIPKAVEALLQHTDVSARDNRSNVSLPGDEHSIPPSTSSRVSDSKKEELVYTINSKVTMEETDITEFKDFGLHNEHGFLLMIDALRKTLNAFLNVNGGRVFFGITDAGLVKGIQLDHRTKDRIRLAVDKVMLDMYPQVDLKAVKFSVSFVPVAGIDGALIPDRHVVVASVCEDPFLDEIGVHFVDRSCTTAYMRASASCHRMKPELIQDKLSHANAIRAQRHLQPLPTYYGKRPQSPLPNHRAQSAGAASPLFLESQRLWGPQTQTLSHIRPVQQQSNKTPFGSGALDAESLIPQNSSLLEAQRTQQKNIQARGQTRERLEAVSRIDDDHRPCKKQRTSVGGGQQIIVPVTNSAALSHAPQQSSLSSTTELVSAPCLASQTHSSPNGKMSAYRLCQQPKQ